MDRNEYREIHNLPTMSRYTCCRCLKPIAQMELDIYVGQPAHRECVRRIREEARLR